jgi:putative membrane-bound dehydrogenase-like protein
MRSTVFCPHRLGSAFLITMLATALPAGDAPPKAGGPGKPLSPQEALKQFRLDAGLRIELVAAEPTIQSPVAMTFDPQGRIWVVEMQDYPNGPAKGEKPRGRIRILEDKDGDGYYESATTFADNLLFANGLMLWKDGAIVTMAPHIVHLRDTDGDGKADRTDVLYEGFAAQNPQLRVSHPILGLDGWVYCANGLRGGKVIRKTPPADAGGSPVVDLSGMDFKFDPVTGAYEAITGLGQYGNTFDEWGNRFVCDNRHHLRHIVMENRYLKRNPYLAAPALVEDISVLEDGPLSSGGKVYPLSRNWTTSSLHEGRFTAACGVFIYHGDLLDSANLPRDSASLPRERGESAFKYHGAAFTCEPTGNLVHMEILTPKGATFSAKPHKQGVEFLATPDDWFRPVFLTHGPDGAMYIVDMYRAVIEHPDFMPPELQKRPDLTRGRDKGRIWRIVPEKHVTKAIRPNLAKATTEELVKTLEHPEPWLRTTAQRLLLERNDKAMIEPLTKLIGPRNEPHATILAAYLLQRHYALTDAMLNTMLLSNTRAPRVLPCHPRVQLHGVRLAESRLGNNEQLRERVFSLLRSGEDTRRDDDGAVRFQIALSLGGLPLDASLPLRADDYVMGYFATQSKLDSWMRLAVESALPEYACVTLYSLLWNDDRTRPDAQLVRELATIVAAQPELAKQHLFLVRNTLEKTRNTQARWSCLEGITTGLARRGKTVTSIAMDLSPDLRAAYEKQLEGMFADAGAGVRDLKQPLDQRLTYLHVIARAPWPTAKLALLPVVNDASTPELRIAALRSLAAQSDKEVPTLLLKLWPSAGPPVRREILEAMLRQPDRIVLLLDEIEANRIKASEIDAVRSRQLVQHGDPKIRERAKKLLQDNLPADRQAVLKEYRAALELKGDAKRGQEVFKKNCATCHRVRGIGIDVGPDIADTRTKTLPALLNDILVPNQAIDNNYINYLVSTRDGRVLTGILAAETATSVTLKRAEGQSDVVLRKDIEEIASTGVSLMPDGLEKHITVPEMADLLRFLKDWRYLDGSVPTSP